MRVSRIEIALPIVCIGMVVLMMVGMFVSM